jgi:hypothetical protein
VGTETEHYPFHRFKSLRFLLTNSKVPRDTKKLVAGVGEKKARVGHLTAIRTYRLTEVILLVGLHYRQEPELVNGILDAIQNITDKARSALADPELPRESLLQALSVRSSFVSQHTLQCCLLLGTSPCVNSSGTNQRKSRAPRDPGCVTSVAGGHPRKNG